MEWRPAVHLEWLNLKEGGTVESLCEYPDNLTVHALVCPEARCELVSKSTLNRNVCAGMFL